MEPGGDRALLELRTGRGVARGLDELAAAADHVLVQRLRDHQHEVGSFGIQQLPGDGRIRQPAGEVHRAPADAPAVVPDRTDVHTHPQTEGYAQGAVLVPQALVHLDHPQAEQPGHGDPAGHRQQHAIAAVLHVDGVPRHLGMGERRFQDPVDPGAHPRFVHIVVRTGTPGVDADHQLVARFGDIHRVVVHSVPPVLSARCPPQLRARDQGRL